MKNILCLGLILLGLLGCDTKDITYPEHSDLKIFINEIMAANEATIQDENGDYDDWFELYNAGNSNVNLNGFLFKNEDKLFRLESDAILTAGSYILIWCDEDSTGIHTNFSFSDVADKLVVFDQDNKLVDLVEFSDQNTDISYGRIPDGGDFGTLYPTPAAANPDPSLYEIAINEFMADNDTTLSDPDFNNFGDWIELYNNSTSIADISGWFLTDDSTNIGKWQIPPATIIEENSFLLIWCDQMDGQPDSVKTVLHTNFTLNSQGEFIGLFRNTGTLEDTLSYGEQTADISFGRFPDGADNWQPFENPTPGESNQP